MKKTTSLRSVLAALTLGASVALVPAAQAAERVLESIHFLIPGGAGGGWDGTARGTGEALTKSGIIGTASYENMSGGGGGKAIAYLIENADSNQDTLMVNSTPIVIRSLTKVFPQSFRDLTMVASTIGDYQALVVSKNSPYKTFGDVVKDFEKVPGSMDHLVAAMAFEAAGQDPTAVKYIPYDAGGKAMAALLSGEIKLLSTGFGEAVGLAQSGEVRILAITAPERQDVAPDAPTLKEQGYNAEFVNWRGFFAAPGLPEAKRQQFIKALRLMYDTPEWEAVRARNGWVNIFHPGDEFTAFLEQQEKVIGNLMRKLGFL